MSTHADNRRRVLLLTVCAMALSFAGLTAAAGDKPGTKLTGHPAVDFFGGSVTVRSDRWSPSQPPLLPEEEQTSGEEKSPWVAGALSLGLPGAGEFYAKSYIKAAAFIAVEATSWIVAYTYNKKGDRQTGDFQVYADQHWSAARYANWTLQNAGTLNPAITDPGSYNVFPNGSNDCNAPFACVRWTELNRLERDISAASANGYTHQLPYYGAQQYYELIGKYDEFSRGWDDADLRPISQSDLPLRSNSKRFYEYAEMRAQANNQYDIASTFVSVAVVNHIVSALDAYWSATRYNHSLHASVKMRVEPTRYGVAPVTEARIEYRF